MSPVNVRAPHSQCLMVAHNLPPEILAHSGSHAAGFNIMEPTVLEDTFRNLEAQTGSA